MLAAACLAAAFAAALAATFFAATFAPALPASLLAEAPGTSDSPMVAASEPAVATPPANGPADLEERLRQLLTDRQIDVLWLLSQGKPNKEIARDLGISEGTVKIHLAAIFRALNVRNRVEAVVRAKAMGICN